MSYEYDPGTGQVRRVGSSTRPPVIVTPGGETIDPRATAPLTAPAPGSARAYREELLRGATGQTRSPELGIMSSVLGLVAAPLRPFDVPGALAGEYLRSRREGTPAAYGEAARRALAPELVGGPRTSLAHETYVRVNSEGQEGSLGRRALGSAAGVAATLAADPLMWLMPLSRLPAAGRMLPRAMGDAGRAAGRVVADALRAERAAAGGRAAAGAEREAARAVQVTEEAFREIAAPRLPLFRRLGVEDVNRMQQRLYPPAVAAGNRGEWARLGGAMQETAARLEREGLLPDTMRALLSGAAEEQAWTPATRAFTQTVFDGVMHAGLPSYRWYGIPFQPYRGRLPGAAGRMQAEFVDTLGEVAGRNQFQVATRLHQLDEFGDANLFGRAAAAKLYGPAATDVQVAALVRRAESAEARVEIMREVLSRGAGRDLADNFLRYARQATERTGRRWPGVRAHERTAGPQVVDVDWVDEAAETAQGAAAARNWTVADQVHRWFARGPLAGSGARRSVASVRAPVVGSEIIQRGVSADLAVERAIVRDALTDLGGNLGRYREALGTVRGGGTGGMSRVAMVEPIRGVVGDLLAENPTVPLQEVVRFLGEAMQPERPFYEAERGAPQVYDADPLVRSVVQDMLQRGEVEAWTVDAETAREVYGLRGGPQVILSRAVPGQAGPAGVAAPVSPAGPVAQEVGVRPTPGVEVAPRASTAQEQALSQGVPPAETAPAPVALPTSVQENAEWWPDFRPESGLTEEEWNNGVHHLSRRWLASMMGHPDETLGQHVGDDVAMYAFLKQKDAEQSSEYLRTRLGPALSLLPHLGYDPAAIVPPGQITFLSGFDHSYPEALQMALGDYKAMTGAASEQAPAAEAGWAPLGRAPGPEDVVRVTRADGGQAVGRVVYQAQVPPAAPVARGARPQRAGSGWAIRDLTPVSDEELADIIRSRRYAVARAKDKASTSAEKMASLEASLKRATDERQRRRDAGVDAWQVGPVLSTDAEGNAIAQFATEDGRTTWVPWPEAGEGFEVQVQAPAPAAAPTPTAAPSPTTAAPPAVQAPEQAPTQGTPPPPEPPEAPAPAADLPEAPQPVTLTTGSEEELLTANINVLRGLHRKLRARLAELDEPVRDVEDAAVTADFSTEAGVRGEEAVMAQGDRTVAEAARGAMTNFYGWPAEWTSSWLDLTGRALDVRARIGNRAKELVSGLSTYHQRLVLLSASYMQKPALREDLQGMPAGTELPAQPAAALDVILRGLKRPEVADQFLDDAGQVQAAGLPGDVRYLWDRVVEFHALMRAIYEGDEFMAGLRDYGVAQIETYLAKPAARGQSAVGQLEVAALWNLAPEDFAEDMAAAMRGGQPDIARTATFESERTRSMSLLHQMREGNLSLKDLERQLPAASLHEALRYYTQQSYAVHLRASIQEWVEGHFDPMTKVRAVRPDYEAQWAALKWRPLQLPLVGPEGRALTFPGLEDYWLPPEVYGPIESLLYSPPLKAFGERAMRLMLSARGLFAGMQVANLESVSFLMANVLEQMVNPALLSIPQDRLGLTSLNGFRAFVSVLPRLVLQGNLGVSSHSLRARIWDSAMQALEQTLAPLLGRYTPEAADLVARRVRELQVMNSGPGLWSQKRISESQRLLTEKLLSNVGQELGVLKHEWDDMLEAALGLVFVMDEGGRLFTFLSRLEMGDGFDAARHALNPTTVNYSPNYSIPMDEWFKVFFWYFMYARQRTAQFFEHFLTRPGLVIGLEEIQRKRAELQGYDGEAACLQGGKFYWMGAEWMPLTWNNTLINNPWLKVGRPGPQLVEGDGQYMLWVRWRLPFWEEPSQVFEMLSSPVSAVDERGLPVRGLQEWEGRKGLDLRQIPVVGRYAGIARKTPLVGPDESVAHAVMRRLGRTGVSDEALQTLVQRDWAQVGRVTTDQARVTGDTPFRRWYHRGRTVPEAARCPLNLVQKHGSEWAMGYEFQKLQLYRDIEQAYSRSGLSIQAVPVKKLLANMTILQLERAVAEVRGKLGRGEATVLPLESYEKELARRRGPKPVGPRDWREQRKVIWSPWTLENLGMSDVREPVAQ